jgi:hypothetical protein
MADPFSTGAGVVGVISLAIQIFKISVEFGLDWKDAPANAKSFMDEPQVLKTVLSEGRRGSLINQSNARTLGFGHASLRLSESLDN